MAVKASTTVTLFNVNDVDSFEIGGRNLIVGSIKYRKDSPFQYTSLLKDGVIIDSLAMHVEKGQKYVCQCRTNGKWGSHITNGTGNGATHIYLGLLISENTTSNADLYISLDSKNRINSDEELGIWQFTVPSDKDYDRVLFRIDIHSDGNTEYSYDYWDFKAEKGDKATDWTPAPEDVKQSINDLGNDLNSTMSDVELNAQRIGLMESDIVLLNDAIANLVTDANGTSLMTQTSQGWVFNIGAIMDTLNGTAQDLKNAIGDIDTLDNLTNILNNAMSDLSRKTAYINIRTDDSGNPCLELGREDSDFKVRITNTSVDFMEGSLKIAYINNHTLYIERAVIRGELQIGESPGWIWKKRANGNLGLRWDGGDS